MHTYFRAIARPEQLHLAETLDRHITVNGDCWVYDGALNHNGYAIMSVGSKKVARAHRVAYELVNGAIPDGLHIDHVQERGCRSRACVRPEHLEAVSQPENNRRAAAWRRARRVGAVVAITAGLTIGASTAAAASTTHPAVTDIVHHDAVDAVSCLTTIGTPVFPDDQPDELAQTGFDPNLLWFGLAGLALLGVGPILVAAGATRARRDGR